LKLIDGRNLQKFSPGICPNYMTRAGLTPRDRSNVAKFAWWVRKNTSTHKEVCHDVAYLVKQLSACRVRLDGELVICVHRSHFHVHLLESHISYYRYDHVQHLRDRYVQYKISFLL